MAKLKSALLWLLGALGIAPLIAKSIEKWADRNGYLDDPTKGFHWLLSAFGNISEWPYFWPLLTFIAGVIVGASIDAVSKRRTGSKVSELRSIGIKMQNLNVDIDTTVMRSLHEWPKAVSILVPEIQSLFLRAEKAGIWVPTGQVLDLKDGGRFLRGYLAFVGKMLADGHIQAANDHAAQMRDEFQALTMHLQVQAPSS